MFSDADLPVLALPVLTDEELFALGGGDAAFVVSPYLQRLDQSARDVAQCVALRSLLARGVVAELTARPGDAAMARLSGEVGLLLETRSHAGTVVALRRLTGTADVLYRYLHLRGGGTGGGGKVGAVLVEDVDPAGLHRFEFVPESELTGLLQAFLVPQGAVAGTGVRRASDAIDILAGAHVVADVVVRRSGGAVDDDSAMLRQLYLGPTGCYRDRPDAGGSDLILEPLDPSDVGAWVVSLTPVRG